MSDYLKSTNFATKDSLPSGNAGKIVKGTEIDNELNAIADAVESKADLLNPIFSGLLTTDTLTTGGATNIGGTLAVSGTFSAAADAQFTGTGRLLLPKGTTAQRPSSPASGSIRYNTELNYVENYTGTEWKPVGKPTPADVSDQTNTSTGYFHVPVGTDAQRTFSPINGLMRYNTTQNIYEGYLGGVWVRFQTVPQGVYTVNYLIAAGGGGGGGTAPGVETYGYGGGGGAGGFFTGTFVAGGSVVYTITVGGGGAAQASGTNSSITGVFTAIGGGRGCDTGASNAASGGSGGGAAYRSGGGSAGGSGTSGQGFKGGDNFDTYLGGGGGGGSSAAGFYANNGSGGAGGAGTVSTITGITTTYAGGGGGGSSSVGGSGGGGNAGSPASASTGSGGGAGAAGGSGVIILSVPTANYTGTYTGTPIITTSGVYTILKFTASGSYTS